MGIFDPLWPNSERCRTLWTIRLNRHWERPDDEYWSAVRVVNSRFRTGRFNRPRITRVNVANYPEEKMNGPRYLIAAMRVRSAARTVGGPIEHIEGDDVVITVHDGYVLAWRREPEEWSSHNDPDLTRAPAAEVLTAWRNLRASRALPVGGR